VSGYKLTKQDRRFVHNQASMRARRRLWRENPIAWKAALRAANKATALDSTKTKRRNRALRIMISMLPNQYVLIYKQEKEKLIKDLAGGGE
jgi:hypothetical protein